MKVGNKILGLAVGHRSIVIAEVATKGDHHVVNRCAEFVFSEGLTMSSPGRMGEELHNFLRTHQFSSKDAVFGLPAKRLVTRRKEVPPASMAMAANTLRVQAEGEFSSELDDLIMDFAGAPSEKVATTVLLMATNRALVGECEALARAAGLRIHGITSTTAALGRATSRLPGGDGMVLSLGPNGAELVFQHGLDPAHLRHLNVTTGADSIPALAAEIRRTIAAIPQNGTPMTLALWNAGAAQNAENVLEQRLSIPVTAPEVSKLALTNLAEAQKFAPAVALALAGLEPKGLAVDFLHSRLAPPKAPGLSMEKKLGIAGGILLAGLVAFAYIDLNNEQTRLAEVKKVKKAHQARVDIANAEILRYKTAEAWLRLDKDASTVSSPVRAALFVAMMRDLTQLFPQQPNTIWATDVACKVSDPYKWEVKGKASSTAYADSVHSAMLRSSLFSDSQLNINVETAAPGQRGSGQTLWNFVLTFTYQGVGYKAPVAPAVKAAPKKTDEGM